MRSANLLISDKESTTMSIDNTVPCLKSAFAMKWPTWSTPRRQSGRSSWPSWRPCWS